MFSYTGPPPQVLALGRRGLEAYATFFVDKYAPEALEEPMAFPVEALLERMGLEVVEAVLSPNTEIMATCLMGQRPIGVYGPRGMREVVFPPGTVLVDPRVRAYGPGAWRNTLVHEAIHWEKDRPLLDALAPGRAPSLCRALDDGSLTWEGASLLGRMEWQAHRLAPRVLMPLAPFRRAVLAQAGRASSSASLLEALGHLFQASKSSVALRIREAGMAKILDPFPDRDAFMPPEKAVEPFTPISPREAEDLVNRQPALRARLEKEDYVYVVDGYFVKNDPAYLCRDGLKNLRVRSIAPAYLEGCALNICRVSGRAYGYPPFPALARTWDQVDKRLLVYHPDFQGDQNLEPEEAYAAAHRELAAYDEEGEKTDLHIITDPHLSLCQSLAGLMDRRGWKYPRQFEEETRLHKNYFGKILRNDYNQMGKENLMSLCIGLGLNLYLTFQVFHKAGMTLKRYEDPDRTYIKILEHAPGLPLDDFNGILRQSHLTELGSSLRA